MLGFQNIWSPLRDRLWGIWGSYYDIPRAIFYLLKGDYNEVLVMLRFPFSWMAMVLRSEA